MPTLALAFRVGLVVEPQVAFAAFFRIRSVALEARVREDGENVAGEDDFAARLRRA